MAKNQRNVEYKIVASDSIYDNNTRQDVAYVVTKPKVDDGKITIN